MTITTNTGTRVSTVTWTQKEWDSMIYMINHNLLPAGVTDQTQAADFILKGTYTTLKTAYFSEQARLRQLAYDAATPTNQAAADSAISFNPNA
jgi:hypothetical protein